MNKYILHVDLNNFYASVEMILNPELKNKFVAVCGSVENRHGIILAKSENAKKLGVKTGMVIRDALKLCPNLVLVEAKHDKYIAYSKLIKNIYRKYTDYIESFGIDECWLDVTSSVKMFGSAEQIANDIRREVKQISGLTVSVGVSFNKVFAKLGSDLKKPDATTVISKENYKEKIWNLPVENLLFVGRSTQAKLNKININTIGDLANTDCEYLLKKFGKWGKVLHLYANGLDDSPVSKDHERDEIKSVGNSMTTYRDLVTEEDVKIIFNVLAESVSARVIEYNIGKPQTLSIYVRDEFLNSLTRQCKLDYPSVLPEDYVSSAFKLFQNNIKRGTCVRTLGISVSDFSSEGEQISFYENAYDKKSKLNDAVLDIRHKYGNESVLKGILLKDKKFMRENDKEGHFLNHDDNI